MTRGELPNEALRAGAEFDAIRVMLARWGTKAVGIGDDAAVVALPRGDALVASVDTAIEGQHFRREWLTPAEVGYRAVTAALSDLAAMAARPIGVLIALALPMSWRGELDALADGIGDAASAAGARILGGNVSAANELSITTTVLGSAFDVLRRDGLRVGDTIYVTGQLGGPGAALQALLRGASPSPEHRARFARPTARIREARWLAERGATSAIDISDGFAADLANLSAASHVRIEVDVARLPLVRGVADPVHAAASGEEYELIAGAAAAIDAAEFERTFGLPLTPVGRAVAGGEEVVLERNGVRVANPGGYDHLSS